MYEACLSLPRNPYEAGLIAENLEALARALRDWPAEAWRTVASSSPDSPGLFDRLVSRTAPAALDAGHKTQALESAEAVAGVLRVLWPESTAENQSEYARQTRPPAMV
jgi:hypothetical protein